jgi:hypothetical protein
LSSRSALGGEDNDDRCRAIGGRYSRNGIGHLVYLGSRSLGSGSLHPCTIQKSTCYKGIA